MIRQIAPAGDAAVLISFETSIGAAELHAAAGALANSGAVAVIPGFDSLLVIFRDAEHRSEFTDLCLQEMLRVSKISVVQFARQVHTLEVSFHQDYAPDLSLLLSSANQSLENFIEQMSEARLQARFAGFRPGFVYLDGLPEAWHLPRKQTSRSNVAGGSFAVSGSMAAFYPADSPGGWNIIGRCAEEFWSPTAESPALIQAGDEVRITPTLDLLPAAKVRVGPVMEAPSSEVDVRVLRPGQRTMIVKAGNQARVRQGLPASGFFDNLAVTAANAAARNRSDATVLEVCVVGPELRMLTDVLLGWGGPDIPVQRNGVTVSCREEIRAAAGDLVSFGRISGGFRGYISVRGGWVDPALEYAFFPAVLAADAGLFVGTAAGSEGTATYRTGSERTSIRVVAGPHPLPESERLLLNERGWVVTPALDRVGIRIRNRNVSPTPSPSLPSCGTQFGTVQWHPNGDLVILGPDGPVTGGYQQPMTVIRADLWKLAQLSPGDEVRWQFVATR